MFSVGNESHFLDQIRIFRGVHVDPAGQYLLYRSYSGAILKACHML